MSEFADYLKTTWLWMLEPPWRHSGPDDERGAHWRTWLLGWAWALCGLAGGALIAPSLLQLVGVADTPYQDTLTIGIAAVAGFIVQFVGWLLYPVTSLAPVLGGSMSDKLRSVIYPFAIAGYGVYRYLTWVGPGQHSVTVAFVGGLLVKTLLIPFTKSIVTGAALKFLIRWLRSGKAKAKSA